ncbi:MAG: transposase [Dolichospermum sp.]
MGLSKSEIKDLALGVYETLLPRPPKRLLAKSFGISRASLYLDHALPDKDNSLRLEIEKWHEIDDTLGCRKLAVLLNTSKNRVFRVMLKYGIYPRRKRPSYKYGGKSDDVADNKLLNGSEEELKHYAIIFSDIFQFRLSDRTWVYCCFIIRKETKQILAFCYGYNMEASLVSTSIERVDLVHDLNDIPVIFHSDQGKQYGAKITLDTITKVKYERSMSRAGTPTDNPNAERFVQTFKLAVTERYSFENLIQFKEYATKWLNFYNNQRPHQSLDQKSPNQYATENGLQTIPYLSIEFV